MTRQGKETRNGRLAVSVRRAFGQSRKEQEPRSVTTARNWRLAVSVRRAFERLRKAQDAVGEN